MINTVIIVFTGCMGQLRACLFIVDTQETEDPTIVIVHPAGQDVKLLCGLRQPSGDESVAWIINSMTPQGINVIANGRVNGYTANLHKTDLIIENIMMNDNRNNTEYQCVIVISGASTSQEQVVEKGDVITVYVAGKCQYT